MKQLGSKLADSVRQVKTQQAENDDGKEQKAPEDKTAEPATAPSKPKTPETPETPLPLFPSRRVWPD